MVAIIVISAILSITIWIVCACLSLDLREKKGYENGLLPALILGIMYLIYCAGLPLCDQQKSDINADTKEKITFCKNCGYQIFEDEKVCKNCITSA